MTKNTIKSPSKLIRNLKEDISYAMRSSKKNKILGMKYTRRRVKVKRVYVYIYIYISWLDA